MNSIIKVHNLTFSYSEEPLRHKDGGQVLKDLSFEVTRGSFVSIVGPNGAGKTTLLNLLCGLLKAQAGYIEIDSAPIQNYSAKKLAKKIAVVRQEFVPVFDFTVAEIVSMGRLPYSDTFGFENKTDKQLVKEALEITDTSQSGIQKYEKFEQRRKAACLHRKGHRTGHNNPASRRTNQFSGHQTSDKYL